MLKHPCNNKDKKWHTWEKMVNPGQAPGRYYPGQVLCSKGHQQECNIPIKALDGKYAAPFAEAEKLNTSEQLGLTPREEEIFTLLLQGSAPKEIAYTLKISYDTVHFHQKNLYRKLNIQSRAELFARFALSQVAAPAKV